MSEFLMSIPWQIFTFLWVVTLILIAYAIYKRASIKLGKIEIKHDKEVRNTENNNVRFLIHLQIRDMKGYSGEISRIFFDAMIKMGEIDVTQGMSNYEYATCDMVREVMKMRFESSVTLDFISNHIIIYYGKNEALREYVKGKIEHYINKMEDIIVQYSRILNNKIVERRDNLSNYFDKRYMFELFFNLYRRAIEIVHSNGTVENEQR